MTKQEITVTCECFAIAGEREVCTIGQGLLTKNGRCRIIHRHKRTVLMCSSNEHSKVTYIKARITGRFQPEERCSVQVLNLRVACRWSHTNLDTEPGKVSFCKHPRSVIAIRWHDQDTPRAKHTAKNSRHSSHARSKYDGCSSLQLTKCLLKMRPGRIVITTIAVG